MNRRIVLIVVAVVLALVGTIAVYSYAHNADKRALNKTRAVSVLIVQKQIPAGTSWSDVLKGNYLKQEKEPVDSVPTNAIANLTASIPVDEVANAEIASGQIALRDMFASQAAVTGALPIPKGMIAVSVAVPADAAVAGYVQYQSQIAIFSTSGITGSGATPAPQANPKIHNIQPATNIFDTKLLIPRVTVIATSQLAPTGVNGKSAVGGNVMLTLAVTQAQAERLILAQETGSLYMALLTDSSVTSEDGGTQNTGAYTPTPIYLK